jgi:hypothetical protein
MKTLAQSFGTRSKQRKCWQQRDQNLFWTKELTPDSSIGLKDREICLKQRWRLLKRRIHKVFSTGNSLYKTASVLRNKGLVRTSWWQQIPDKTWIRDASLKPESPLRDMHRKKSLVKAMDRQCKKLIAILSKCISPSGQRIN